jgi:hypothetical protein
MPNTVTSLIVFSYLELDDGSQVQLHPLSPFLSLALSCILSFFVSSFVVFPCVIFSRLVVPCLVFVFFVFLSVFFRHCYPTTYPTTTTTPTTFIFVQPLSFADFSLVVIYFSNRFSPPMPSSVKISKERGLKTITTSFSNDNKICLSKIDRPAMCIWRALFATWLLGIPSAISDGIHPISTKNPPVVQPTHDCFFSLACLSLSEEFSTFNMGVLVR